MPLLRAIKCATIARERFPRADSAGSVRSLNCLGLLFRPSLALPAFLPFPPCAVLPRLHLSSPPLQNSHSTAISLFPVSVSSAYALSFTSAFFCGKISQVELSRCFPRFFLVCFFIAHLEN